MANGTAVIDSKGTPSAERSQDWDLSALYASFDDPKFHNDLETVQTQVAEFRETYRGKVAALAGSDPEAIAQALIQLEIIYRTVDYLYSYPSLVFAADTADTEAQQAMDKMQKALTVVQNDLLFFELELQTLDSAAIQALQQHPSLASYGHYLQNIGKFAPYRLDEAVEQVRNQDNLTGRRAFIQLRSEHISQQTYEPVTGSDGTVAETEADLSALIFQGDRDIRYKSYKSVRQVSKTHNSLYTYILSSVAQDHATENKLRGYKSTLEKQLLADEVPADVFWAIMDGTKARFDLWQRYYKLKAGAIGDTIRTCDVYAPWDAEPTPISYDQGVDILLDALKKFDDVYAGRASEFFTQNLVDARVRPTKRGGAFCAYSPGKKSFLLLSYTNDYSSLFTLAHEMGHGLHFDWIDAKQSYLNSNPPMILAEVASTFNELLLLDYLLEKETDLEAQKALITQQIEDQLNLLFRQSTISRLELAVHEKAAEGRLDTNFVNDTWKGLYQELCGDVVEVLPEHQYDWARIGHIYFKPFYCYQYTASNIVSLACYQQYKKQGRDFIPGYLELLAAGGSENQIDALRKYVGVDLANPQTIADALAYVDGLMQRLEAAL
ncbi:MAG: M3 family metallopeptidase [Cyanobacteria bacterium P01_F01_bin.153]